MPTYVYQLLLPIFSYIAASASGRSPASKLSTPPSPLPRRPLLLFRALRPKTRSAMRGYLLRALSRPTNAHQCLLFFRALRPPPAQRCVGTFCARSLSLPNFYQPFKIIKNQNVEIKTALRVHPLRFFRSKLLNVLLFFKTLFCKICPN